jgi:hypothetical protein
LASQTAGTSAARPLPPNPEYQAVVDYMNNIPPPTRSNPNPELNCECPICPLGRAKGHTVKRAREVGRPRVNPPDPRLVASSEPVCGFCFERIHKGVAHPCTKKAQIDNLSGRLPERSKGQMASRHIKETVTSSGSPAVALSTFGRPFRVEVASRTAKKDPTPLSHEAMLQIQKDTGMSDNQVLKIARALRVEMGRKSIQPHLASALTKSNKECEDFFKLTEVSFSEKVPGSEGQEPTFKEYSLQVPLCQNVVAFVGFILEKRNIKGGYTLKSGMDGGGGSFKICLNVISDPPSTPKSLSQSPDAKKPARFLETGVKKLFLLAVASKVPESYSNVKSLLAALNLSSLDYLTTLDLKLCNIVSGIQSASSTFPCYICEAKKPFLEESPLRTLGMIRANASQFHEDGANFKDAKHYKSCVNEPLFDQPGDTLMIELMPPPELHLMLGIVNRIYDALNEVAGANQAYEWGEKHNIIRSQHRGGGLEGNQCKLLLEKSEALLIDLPAHLKKYAQALIYFNKVRKSTFGKILGYDFKQDIEAFRVSYMALGINITPKTHIVLSHVGPYCERKGMGLGSVSEQAVESSHFEFKRVFSRVNVSENHSEFPTHLLKALNIFNSKNL